jgi:hypothetical protein
MPLSLPAYPLINGLRPDFACIQFTPQLPDGSATTITGIKSLNYKVEQDPTEIYGTSPLPLGMTRGTAKFSGDVEMYVAEFQAIVDAIGPDFGSVPIDIAVSYSEGAYTKTDFLQGVRLLSPEASQSQGADALTRKFSMKMLNILFDGIAPVLPFVG